MKKKAQKFLAHWAAPTGMGLYEISLQNLIDFGELVEQATLELAAVECERSEMYRGSIFAARIRKLKEPQ